MGPTKNSDLRQFLLHWLLEFGIGEVTGAELAECGWYWESKYSCWSAQPYIKEGGTITQSASRYSITQAGLDLIKGG